jgi:ABC-2 type transport system ATP-binding protein
MMDSVIPNDSRIPALDVRDVHYAYGRHKAVAGVSFAVQPGEIFGLLGPNGAGKTTTLAMIAGLLPPLAGEVLVFGEDVGHRSGRARARMGVVPQEIALYEELGVRENVAFWARLSGVRGKPLDEAVTRTLERVGLADRAKSRVSTLSGGLKRRVNLASGLAHGPALLLLDEPTVGIDPQARLAILDVVRDEARAGCAVLYTSHYLEEAEAVCDRLAIVDHGRVLAMGTVAELRRLVGVGPTIAVRGRLRLADLRPLAERVAGIEILASPDGSFALAARDEAGCASFVRELLGSGLHIEDLRVQEPSLQSLFLKLTGRELRD